MARINKNIKYHNSNYKLSDLLDIEDFLDKVIFNDSGVPKNHCQFFRIGKLVLINYQGGTSPKNSGFLLFTIPDGYRPNKFIYVNIVINAAAYGTIQINPNGEVTIGMLNTQGLNQRIYTSFCYLIEN